MTDFAEMLRRHQRRRGTIENKPITAHGALNEAYAYAKPSSFSRGLRIDLNGLAHPAHLRHGLRSAQNGESVHVGDFRAQMRRTLPTSPACSTAEGATWHDIVRTTCYLRDIDRDYAAFNEERTAFFKEQGLDPLPASTGIEAKLCRPELLVEIEAIAMFRTQGFAQGASSCARVMVVGRGSAPWPHGGAIRSPQAGAPLPVAGDSSARLAQCCASAILRSATADRETECALCRRPRTCVRIEVHRALRPELHANR